MCKYRAAEKLLYFIQPVSIMVMYLLFIIALAIVGAVFGSFAGAQVWRNRAQHLEDDRKAGEKIDESEFKKLKPLLGRKLSDDRSRCLSCRHELRWYDLVPVLSWIALRGRCRYCKEFIGWSEIILELAVGGLFVLSGLLWPAQLDNPLEIVKFILWLIALVSLAVNFVYDLRWSLLLTRYNWVLLGSGLVFAGISLVQSTDVVNSFWSLLGSVAILGGLYAILWMVSRGRWVGEGDIYLGAGLALFLGDWRLAFVALFAANLLGTLLVFPGIASGKLKRQSQVPFGPLLIIGGIASWFWGDVIINWYISIVFLV